MTLPSASSGTCPLTWRAGTPLAAFGYPSLAKATVHVVKVGVVVSPDERAESSFPTSGKVPVSGVDIDPRLSAVQAHLDEDSDGGTTDDHDDRGLLGDPRGLRAAAAAVQLYPLTLDQLDGVACLD